jgi:hypothetical protein
VGRLRCAEVRYGRPGSADGTSCAAAESARSLAPTLRAFSATLRRPTRGPDQERPSSAFGTFSRKREKEQHSLLPLAGEGARRADEGNRSEPIPSFALALRGSPFAARSRRKKPAGARAGCACVRCQAKDGLSANLRSGLAQSAGDRAHGVTQPSTSSTTHSPCRATTRCCAASESSGSHPESAGIRWESRAAAKR